MDYKTVNFIEREKDSNVLEIREEDVIPIDLENDLEVRDCGEFECKGIWLSDDDAKSTYHIVRDNADQLVLIKVRK